MNSLVLPRYGISRVEQKGTRNEKLGNRRNSPDQLG